MSFDYSIAVIKQAPRVYKRGKVFFNKDTFVPINDPFEATHFLIIGSTGGGKTFLIAVIMSQAKHGLFFDGKGGGKFQSITQELGIEDEWEFYNIEGFNNLAQKDLKINVRDLSPEILNILEVKKDGNLRIVRSKLEEFLSLPSTDEEKTYDKLEELLVYEKPTYEGLFRELRCILDENDEGISLKDLIAGRKCIDLNGFNVNNRSIGVLASMALQYKKLHDDGQKLVFALDEADTCGRIYTALNEAFSTVFRQGRSSNISGLVSATAHGALGGSIVQNSKVFFFFECTKRQTNSIWHDFGVDLKKDEFDSMKFIHEKGNCVLLAPNFGYVSQKMMHIDADFFRKQIKEQEEIDYELADASRYVNLL